jgi:hypothetical protein
MSLHSYQQSIEISAKEYQFSALIMAAIRKADSVNTRILSLAFPDIAQELDARYESPDGKLPGES